MNRKLFSKKVELIGGTDLGNKRIPGMRNKRCSKVMFRWVELMMRNERQQQAFQHGSKVVVEKWWRETCFPFKRDWFVRTPFLHQQLLHTIFSSPKSTCSFLPFILSYFLTSSHTYVFVQWKVFINKILSVSPFLSFPSPDHFLSFPKIQIHFFLILKFPNILDKDQKLYLKELRIFLMNHEDTFSHLIHTFFFLQVFTKRRNKKL